MSGGFDRDGLATRGEPGVREVITRAPEQTRALGRRLGARAEPGQVFALSGPLGAGKTELARGLLGGMGVPESEVLSPTFTLIHEHQGRLPVVHVDAYRLERPEELFDLGLDDALLRGAAAVIEWADRLGRLLPRQRLHAWLSPAEGDAGARRIRLEAHGEAYVRLLGLALASEE